MHEIAFVRCENIVRSSIGVNGREYSRAGDLRIFDATPLANGLILMARAPGDLGIK
jgi:hypothetical protein